MFMHVEVDDEDAFSSRSNNNNNNNSNRISIPTPAATTITTTTTGRTSSPMSDSNFFMETPPLPPFALALQERREHEEKHHVIASIAPTRNENESITLYVWPPAFQLISSSPFCIKVETFLRFTNIPYRVSVLSRTASKNRSPTGRLPYIELNGRAIADSSVITETLTEHFGVEQLDSHLSLEQKAVSLAFQRLLEEHLYHAIMYFRWIDEDGANIIYKEIRKRTPLLLRCLLSPVIELKLHQRRVRKQLREHGIGRHIPEEILQFLKKDIKALSDFLGDEKPFFFGDQPSSLDAIAFAFISYIFLSRFSMKLEHILPQNLILFYELIRSRYFIDWDDLVEQRSASSAVAAAASAALRGSVQLLLGSGGNAVTATTTATATTTTTTTMTTMTGSSPSSLQRQRQRRLRSVNNNNNNSNHDDDNDDEAEEEVHHLTASTSTTFHLPHEVPVDDDDEDDDHEEDYAGGGRP